MTNALQSLINGSRKGTREQTTLTPSLILDPIRTEWDGIAMDPCAAPEGRIWVPCTLKHKPDKTCRHCENEGGVYVVDQVRADVPIRLPGDGLACPWLYAFVNPPYDNLKPWLLHEQILPDADVAWLVPVRPHRRWWRTWARERVEEIVYLNPFKFEGHSTTFPAPVCLGLRGPKSARVARAFEDLDLGARIT